MKTKIKPIILCIAILAWCFPCILEAQETKEAFTARMEAIQVQENVISTFINQKLSEPYSAELYEKFLQSIEHRTGEDHQGDHMEFTSENMPSLFLSYRQDYYRTLYFELHPEIKKIYDYSVSPELNKHKTRNGSLICANGTLETGLTGFNGSQGTFNTNNSCAFIPLNAVSNFTPGFSNITHVTAGLDPIVNTITRTHGGSAGAVRINSTAGATPIPGYAACMRWGRINRLSMPFTTTQNGNQVISFAFALVMESPGHDPGTNPFFVARVINTTTNQEEFRICEESTPNNPFFQQGNFIDPNYPTNTNPPSCPASSVAMNYVNWTCASLPFNGNTSHTYAIEFFVAGCHESAGGHFGYAYIDDICINCNGDQLPTISLQPTDTCLKSMSVCAEYTLPIFGGNTGSLITTGANAPTLTVLQNGVPTVPSIILTNPVINTTSKTICFTVNAATFGTLTGGFDFRINANFALAGGIVPVSDVHTNTGLNNDYTTNPCVPACACGSWSTTVLTGINGTSLTPGFYPCGTTIANRTISKGQSYRIRFRYNCTGTCNATYNFIENINGTVVSSPASGGGINIDFTPNESDCGLRSITVTPTCGGMICPPCTICFYVVGCDNCVDPVNDTIYCAPTYGKPIFTFCLKNLKPTPIQFYGVSFPTNLQLTTFTLPGDPVPIDTMLDGTIVYKTSSPIITGNNACTFRYRIDGGVYKGQQFCVMVKSFSAYDPATGNFLNCCQDTIPLCFTVPDCIDDCADIVNASISCNMANQRVLSFQIKNNTPNTLGAFEHFRVFALPNDYFSGFFSLAPGATSSVITHIIPNTIPSGSQYCFTENVHWYYSNGHTCDSICYADTVCLTVPYCGIYPGGDTIKSGTGGSGTIGGGMGKLTDPFKSGSNGESTINLYPNPTDGLLHIESPYSEQGIHTISIKDMSGREVYFRKAENTHRELLNISQLPSGIYIVTINNSKNFRLIKN